MVFYVCSMCGRKYEIDNICCAEPMTMEKENTLVCRICSREKEIPRCCPGTKMIRKEE